MRILLTDGQQRKTLAFARSLGSRGHGIWIGDTTRFSMSSFSRYSTKRFVYPSPAHSPLLFAEKLMKTTRDDDIGIVVPMDDDSIEALLAYPDSNGFGEAVVVLPPLDAFGAFRDKAVTAALAARVGVGVPRTITLDTGSGVSKTADAGTELGYPFVMKPRKGSGGRGFFMVPDESTARSDQMDYHRLEERYGPMMAQEYRKGVPVDACMLMDSEGRIRASFVQRELRHFPLRGGTSTVQESIHLPELIEPTAGLLRAAGYVGVAEAEYLVDPETGGATLMEVNPRFWASLQLAIDCGVDFPDLLVRMAMGHDDAHPGGYPAGRMARWTLPGDILHFVSNPDRFRMEPGFLDMKSAKDDILWPSDPGPVIGFVLACLRYSLDPGMWRMLLRR